MRTERGDKEGLVRSHDLYALLNLTKKTDNYASQLERAADSKVRRWTDAISR
jgi:hypothetical protein